METTKTAIAPVATTAHPKDSCHTAIFVPNAFFDPCKITAGPTAIFELKKHLTPL
jgi:hypothetical protein